MAVFSSHCLFLFRRLRFNNIGDIDIEVLRGAGEYKRRKVIRVVGDGTNLVYHEEIHLSRYGTTWMVYLVKTRRTRSPLIMCAEIVADMRDWLIRPNGEGTTVPAAVTQ